MESQLKEIYDSILNGDNKSVAAQVQAALDAGIDTGVVLNQGMVAAMAEVGRLFEEGEYFVPEMLVSARTMQTGLAVLKPHMVESNIQSTGKVAIGTVKGDLHDIGKNLVAMMLEGAAFEIVDLGVDVTPDKFVNAVQEKGVDLIAMSALLTTTMTNMKATIEALNTSGMRGKVKVMVGGAPLTAKFAEEIGADGYAADASKAVALAKQLMA